MKHTFTAYFHTLRLALCGALWLTTATAGHGQSTITQEKVTVAIAPEYDRVGKGHRFWFGENYRHLWATPVTMRVLHLNQEKGGLTIVKEGGGLQTKSLRLQNASGKEWVLRTIQKNPGRGLPENLRQTVYQRILQDQVSTVHPYAPLTVPTLAAALQIPHANPEVVYLPDDPALGEYRQEFANGVYLLEERAPLYLDDTDNTEKILNRLRKDNDRRVDQRKVLRARLLDLLVGDWDRHEDQWRWSREQVNDEDIYSPIPRDRDQVYYNTSGVFPNIISRKWLFPRFQGFHEDIRDVNGLMYNARFFDRYFLYGLSEEDWRQEISYVQQQLTNDVITRAIRQMPENIYSLSGEAIIRKLKARRDHLMKDGLAYYRFLATSVDVPGTDHRENFALQYQESGNISLQVHNRKKDGSNGRLLYQRTFQHDVTEEIRLYGLGDTDHFRVQGNSKSPIKVRLIGGDEEDTFEVDAQSPNRRRLFLYDRSDEPNSLPNSKRVRLRTAKDTAVNSYNLRSFFEYDKLMPQVSIGFNLDDGVILGAGFVRTTHGFRKEPFATRHRLLVAHALATKAFFIDYSGYFTQLIGKYDLSIDVDANAPDNTSNFFGAGNETVFLQGDDNPMNDKEIRYYRTRYDFISTQVKLNRRLGKHWRVNAGVLAQYYSNNRQDNTDRFITLYQQQVTQENVFATKTYLGAVAGVQTDTRNHAFLPSKGIFFEAAFTGTRQLNGNHEKFGQALGDFSFYFSPTGSANFVIANRIGGGTTVGTPAFFQLLYLGGTQNLRGYRKYRFAGESMAYHNLEARVKLFDFTSYLFPGTVGLTAFHDTGRVWMSGESSSKWHTGYGAGIYVVPAQLLLLQGSVGISTEGVLPTFSLGFNF